VTTPRIVSLLPSATEIVCALGLRDALVGVSHECDFPADVVGLPVLTRSKLDAERPSAEIDRDIKSMVGSGLGIYAIDVDALRALKPDLIVTQDQCEVCAVSYADVRAAVCELTDVATEIVSLRPERLDDVWRDVEPGAAAAGVAARGRTVADDLRARIAALARRTESLPRARLACLEWLDPLMAAGNWVPDLASAAGAICELATPGSHSPWLDFEALVADRPDVLCAMPCGFTLERSHDELAALLGDPRWQELPAVRSGRVFAVDGSSYFNRPGPRLVESAEILAALLHPDTFDHLLPEGAARRVAGRAMTNEAASAPT
jgi:iron complex transport system substrate-binding protein